MPLINSAAYTGVRSALDGCIEDIILDLCGYPDLHHSDVLEFLHRLINKQILDTELENYVELQAHHSYKLLMSFWHYDEKAQKALKNTYGQSDKPTTQACVLQSILDDINGLEATTPDIEVNSIPHLQGEKRLSELAGMEANETNPLIKQKLQLEIAILQNDLTHEKQSLDQKCFEDFKIAYKNAYKAAFFKNPWSTMKSKLERLEFTKLEEIEQYAKNNPKTRSAKILNRLKTTWDQPSQQQNKQTATF